jgi:hypothetical protein
VIDQSTLKPIVWLNDNCYITLVPDAAYNLEVWERDANDHDQRLGRMDYKFHRDTFAGFIYRLCGLAPFSDLKLGLQLARRYVVRVLGEANLDVRYAHRQVDLRPAAFRKR